MNSEQPSLLQPRFSQMASRLPLRFHTRTTVGKSFHQPTSLTRLTATQSLYGAMLLQASSPLFSHRHIYTFPRPAASVGTLHNLRREGKRIEMHIHYAKFKHAEMPI